jgi:hypothetical protein
MRMTLKQYSELPVLSNNEREKLHRELMYKITDDPIKYLNDIEEMVDYFITELGNADFIRLVDKIREVK